MYKATLISTHHNIDLWRVTGYGKSFLTEFMHGCTPEQVQDFYNN